MNRLILSALLLVFSTAASAERVTATVTIQPQSVSVYGFSHSLGVAPKSIPFSDNYLVAVWPLMSSTTGVAMGIYNLSGFPITTTIGIDYFP